METGRYEHCIIVCRVSANSKQGAESLAQLHERIILTFVPVGDDDARITTICSQASSVSFPRVQCLSRVEERTLAL